MKRKCDRDKLDSKLAAFLDMKTEWGWFDKSKAGAFLGVVYLTDDWPLVFVGVDEFTYRQGVLDAIPEALELRNTLLALRGRSTDQIIEKGRKDAGSIAKLARNLNTQVLEYLQKAANYKKAAQSTQDAHEVKRNDTCAEFCRWQAGRMMLEYGIPFKSMEKNLDKAIDRIIKGQQPFLEDRSRDYPFDEENLKKQVAYGKKKQGRGKK